MIHIRNWKTFQGYEKRGPDWIKLHVALIDNPDWIKLPTVSKAILPPLWIAYSRQDSKKGLPEDLRTLSILTHMPESDLKKGLPALKSFHFIECDGFVADPATEVSGEEIRGEESRSEKSENTSASADALSVMAYWQNVMGHSAAKFTKERKRAVEARLNEGYTREQLCQAVDGCRASPHHMGKNDNQTVYDDLELICRTGTKVEQFIRYLEPVRTGPQGLAGVQAAGMEKARKAIEAQLSGVREGNAAPSRLLPEPGPKH